MSFARQLSHFAGITILVAAIHVPLADARPTFETVIPPGYAPDANTKWDEQGIWMEMQSAESTIKRSPLLIDGTELDAYVKQTACRIADDYCDDLRVYVLKNPHFNASMAPNGVMIVHSGLLVRVTSTDELAAVLGHELAHYTQAHSLKRFRAAKNRLAMGMVIGAGLGGAGIPELIAVASVMGFSRSQESEADVIGTHFMQRTGMDPRAAANVWAWVIEEERRALVKYPKDAGFLSSHPAPQKRQRRLEALAKTMQVDTPGTNPTTTRPHDDFARVLQTQYQDLMDIQVSHGDFGRLSSMLDRHAAMGIHAADVNFYRGEAWRLRRGAGDHEHAMEAYRAAVAADPPNVNALRELGYLELKHGDKERATELLRDYLDRRPEAADREMIEFYIQGGW